MQVTVYWRQWRAGHPAGPESVSLQAVTLQYKPAQNRLHFSPATQTQRCISVFQTLHFQKEPTLFVTRSKVMHGHWVIQQVAKPHAAVKRKWISKHNQNREPDGCALNTSCFQITILCVPPATETNVSCNPWMWSLLPAAQLLAGQSLKRERWEMEEVREDSTFMLCWWCSICKVIFLTKENHKSLSDSEAISPVSLFWLINHICFKKAGRQEKPHGHQLAVLCW